MTVDKTNRTLRAQGLVRLGPGIPTDFSIHVVADGVTIEGFEISG